MRTSQIVSLGCRSIARRWQSIQARQFDRQFGASRRQNRRHEIDAGTQFLSIGWRNNAWPAKHDRSSSTLLVGAPFGSLGKTPLIAVLRQLCPAVVGNINQQLIFAKLFLIEVFQSQPASLVKPFAHGPVAGPKQKLRLYRRLSLFCLIFFLDVSLFLPQ